MVQRTQSQSACKHRPKYSLPRRRDHFTALATAIQMATSAIKITVTIGGDYVRTACNMPFQTSSLTDLKLTGSVCSPLLLTRLTKECQEISARPMALVLRKMSES